MWQMQRRAVAWRATATACLVVIAVFCLDGEGWGSARPALPVRPPAHNLLIFRSKAEAAGLSEEVYPYEKSTAYASSYLDSGSWPPDGVSVAPEDQLAKEKQDRSIHRLVRDGQACVDEVHNPLTPALTPNPNIQSQAQL